MDYNEYNPKYDDIHSFIENIEFIKYSRKEYTIIVPSYMICNIDYEKVLNQHKKLNNDITMIYKKTINNNLINCEEIIFDDKNSIKEIKKINNISKKPRNINMEMYIMKTSIFINIIRACVMSGLYKKIKDYIKNNLNSLKVGTYEFNGYLVCINSVNSYFNVNKNLLDREISNELLYNSRSIFTKQKDEAPVYYSRKSNVTNSIIANGYYIEGSLENSILGRKVKVME